ncbi:MAG: O-acetyl-ADP-ribose deacetylase [Candidatus Binatia bacterium]|nr:O-acetyl-ADP-ribose deacetylase [Candidatus Binatia bacterium]
MDHFALTETCTLVLQEGDLTRVSVDAIVNAANEQMLGGGGVDSAIHRAAGPELLDACREAPEAGPGVRCPTGEARLTPGFDLPARYVIHTVGPVYVSAATSAPLLRNAYRASLALAHENGLESVAFPAISCGVFGYPLGEAAPLSITTCRESVGTLSEIHFVLFGEATYRAWSVAAKEIC